VRPSPTGLAVVGSVFLVSLALAYCAGGRDQRQSLRIAAAKTQTRADEAKRTAAVETVYVAAKAVAQLEPKVAAAHEAVGVVDSVTLSVRSIPAGPPTLIFVPPAVVNRLVVDSLEVQALKRQVRALELLTVSDSAVIRDQRKTIDLLEKQHGGRCQAKCGAVVAVVAIIGTAVAVDHGRDIVGWVGRVFHKGR
jgi:hypothetical protein